MVGISITDSISKSVKIESLQNKGVVTLQVEAGQNYRIIDLSGDFQNSPDWNVEQQALLENVVALRKGNDLILHYADGTEIVLEDYFVECENNACSITLSGEGDGFIPTENSPLGAKLDDGSFVIYGHGKKDVLMSMVQDIQSAFSIVEGLTGEFVTYTPLSTSFTGGDALLSAGVFALGVGTAGIGGGKTVQLVDTTAPDAPLLTSGTGDDGLLTVNGTAEPGSLVEVTFPDGSMESVLVDSNGEFNITSSSPQPDGVIIGTATDADGNESDPAILSYDPDGSGGNGRSGETTDITAPSVPTVMVASPEGDSVSGQAEPGSEVVITGPDGSLLGVVLVGTNGGYQFPLRPALTNGEMVSATATDASGNISEPGSGLAPDTTAPMQTISIVDITADSGVTGDFTTNDTDGLTVVASLSAVLELGEVLEYSNDAGITWVDISASVSGSVISHMDATLTSTSTIHMRVTDVAGNSGSVATQLITIDAAPPTTNVAITGVSNDTGVADYFTSDDDGLTISATLSNALGVDERLEYSSDNGVIWNDISDAVTGTSVSYFDSGLTSTVTIQMRVTDNADNSGAVDSQLITIDSSAPTTTVIINSISDDSGMAGDFITSDVDGLTIGATLSVTLNTDERLEYSNDNGITWADITTSVSGTVVSHVDVGLTSTATIQMRVADAAGNTGAAATQLITIDTSVPSQTIIINSITDDTGTVGDFITNDNDGLTIDASLSVMLGADEVLEYSNDSGATWNDATASVSGTNISHVDTSLTSTNTIQFRVSDGANTGAVASQLVTIDITAPTQIISIDSISDDSGTAGDFITSDNDGLTINGSLSEELVGGEILEYSNDNGATWVDATSSITGTLISHTDSSLTTTNTVQFRVTDGANIGAVASQLVIIDTGVPTQTIEIDGISDDSGAAGDFITNDTDGLTITGTLSAALNTGERLEYSSDNGSTWTDVSTSVTGTVISHEDTGLSSTSTVQFRVIDASDNSGASTSQLIRILGDRPSTTVSIDSISDDTGMADFVTSDEDGLIINGILSAVLTPDETLEYSNDDGLTWVDISASVSATVVNYVDTGLTGTSTIHMRVTDIAGNSGSVATQLITIDAAPPTVNVTITEISDDTGVADFITNDNDGLTISATLSAGLGIDERLEYSNDNGLTWSDISGAVTGTSVSYIDSSLTSSATIHMRVTDTAENSGAADSQLITIDTVASTITVTIDSISEDTGAADDFITADTDGLVINATLSEALSSGDSLMYSSDGGLTWGDITGSVSGVAVSHNDSALTTSTTIQMRVVDLAGNNGIVVAQAITIVGTGPSTVVSIDSVSDDSGVADFITNDNDGLTISATLSAALSIDERLEYSTDDGVSWTDISTSVSGVVVSHSDATLTGTSTIQMRVTDVADNSGTVAIQLITIDVTAPATTVSIDSITDDTGMAGDFITSDNDGLVITGTLSAALTADERLEYSSDDGNTWTDITASVIGSAISHVDNSLTSTTTIEMRVSDIADNTGPVVSQLVNVDTTAPVTTVTIDSISDDTGVADFVTSDNDGLIIAATLSEALEVGERLMYSRDGGSTWADITSSISGTAVSHEDIGLTQSTTIQMRVEDAAANAGSVVSQAVVIDTTSPTTTVSIDSISDDTGVADFITNDNDGLIISATLSAALASDERLEYSSDDGASWSDISASVTGTGVSHTDAALTSTSTIQMRISDAAGNSGAASNQLIAIDGASPTTTVSIDGITDDTGTSNDFITNDTDGLSISATLSDSLIAGERLEYSSDNGVSWTDISSSVSGTGVSHIDTSLTSTTTIHMRVIDTADNSGTVDTQLITVDITPPTIIVSIDSISDDTGIAGDFITADTDGLTVSATLSAPLGAGDALMYSIDGGSTWLDISASASGTTVIHSDAALTTSATIQMRVEDVAGNLGSSAAQAITIIGTGPSTIVNIDSISDDSGAEDFITNDNDGLSISATLSAVLAAGERLEYSSDNGNTWSDISTSVSGTAVNHNDVSLTSTTTIQMRVTDLADNTGAADIQLISIDTTEPTTTVSIDSITDDTGASDFITSDNDGLTVVATLSSVLEADERLEYSNDNGSTWTDISASVTGVSISHIDVALTNTTTIQMRVTDNADNSGVVNSQLITIDTGVPTQTLSIDGISDDTGTSGDFITNDEDGLTISATLSAALGAGEALEYSNDNGVTWVDATSSVAGIAVSHVDTTLTTTNTVQFRVNDGANTGITASQLVTIDTAAPAQTVSITGIIGDSGVVGDFITNDIDVLIIRGKLSASLGAGEMLEFSDDGGSTWLDISNTVIGTNIGYATNSLTSTTNVQMRVSDVAGNNGIITSQLITIDSIAPTQTITIDSITDDTGVVGDYITRDNDGLSISATLSSALGTDERLEYRNDNGSWSDISGSVAGTSINYTDNSLTSTTTIQMRVTDVAGNSGTATSQLITIDVTALTIISFDSSTADGYYNEGDTITISAITSKAVQAGNSFDVTLDTGDVVTLTATVEGSSLTGTYTVGMGDGSLDLTISSYTTGTVQDVAGNVMTDTSLPAGNNLADNKAIVVDTTSPVFPEADQFGSEEVISSTQDNVRDVFIADIDGDGDLDVLSASIGDDTVAWFENDGAGNFGPQQVISNTQSGAWAVTAADFDGDGDLDILSGSSTSGANGVVAWFENDGSGNFGAEQLIDSAQLGTSSVTVADLDGDGDIDAISASYNDDTIAWYANDGLGNFGTKRVIDDAQNGAREVIIADVDGDGDLDVLSAAGFGDTVSWFANDGTGNFGTEQVISNTQDGVNSVAVGDIDGDGDLDVLSASLNDDTVAWFANDGSGNFGAEQTISDTQDGAVGVATADVDGDGDLDVLSASRNDGALSWFANDGTGSFGAEQTLGILSNAWSVAAEDLDGDGDIDVLSGAYGNNTVSLFRNLTLSVVENSGANQIVYTEAATDNIAVTSYSLGGTDATLFTIDSATGAVTLTADPDFESRPSYSFDVIASDAAGNTTTESVSLKVVNLKEPPVTLASITSAIDNVGGITGVLGDGDSTDDTSLSLTGTLDAALVGSEEVRIYDGTSLLGTATVTDTNWTFSDPRTLSAGDTPSYTAVVSDDGEGTASAAFDLTIDTTGPSVFAFSAGSTPDGAYKEGDTISIAAVFDELILAGSSFEVTLDTGDVVIMATAFDSTVLFGTYIVGAGDSSLDLNVTSYTVGTVQDTEGNAMNTTALPASSNLADNKDLVIDTTAPVFAVTAPFFGAEETISTTQDSARAVTTADVDGDGDLDVLSASSNDDTVAWFANDGAGNFGPEQVISNTQDGAVSVTTADVDGDGDLDVVSASQNDNTVAWFANDGAGNFGAEQVINNTQFSVWSVVTADVDGDGDLDVVSASLVDDTVAWFANDGLGNFGPEQVISNTQDNVQSVTTADVDGDGDLDVLSASEFDDTVAWFANDGAGNFGAEQVISTTLNGPISVTTADIDGDGDLDVVSASVVDNTVAWFANDGSGNFGVVQVISTTQVGAISVTAADVDGDGDLDVVSASLVDDTVAWFANDGSGNFGPEQVISTTQDEANSVITADVDGDGDLDVLSVSRNDDTVALFRNQTHNIIENTGAGQAVYTADVTDNIGVTSYSLGGADASAFDIDNGTGVVTLTADPDYETQSSYSFDVIAGDAAGNTTTESVTLNVTNVADRLSTTLATITSASDDVGSITGSLADGDTTDDTSPELVGMIDTALLGSEEVRIYDGTTLLGTAAVTGTNWSYVDSRTLSDGDTPSYTAVVSDDGEGTASAAFDLTIDTTGPSVFAFSAGSTPDGAYKEGDTISIAAVFDDLILAGSSFEVTLDTGDVVIMATAFDSTVLFGTYIVGAGDSSLDLNVTSYTVGTVQDTEGNAMSTTALPADSNLADNKDLVIDTTAPIFTVTAPFFGAEETISTTQDGPRSTAAADVDGDGDIDVVAVSRNDDVVAWYANDGDGNFGTEQVIVETLDAPIAVVTADVDGDGDLDVITAFSGTDTISWFANDGAGNFGSEQIISATQDGADSVEGVDIDGDGDLDVLSAAFNDDTVAWFENDGTGNFGSEQTISLTQDGARKAVAADIDGDGDMDVLSASAFDNTVAWFENDGTGNFGAEQVISAMQSGAISVFAADLDGDGDLDVLSASEFDDTVAWFANDGAGNFGPEQVISTGRGAATSVTAVDVDADGDFDVVLASSLEDSVTWFANDGTGNFGAAQFISTTRDGANSVFFADIDGSGDQDLLVTSAGDDGIVVYRSQIMPNLQILENSGAGQVVYTAAATDDIAVVSYSLAGTDAGAFSINSDTGAVTLTGDPDYETQSSYRFEVIASDAAGNTAMESVSLNVTNVEEPSTTLATISNAIDDAGGITGELVDGDNTDDTSLSLTGTLDAALLDSEEVRLYDGVTLLGLASVTGTNWTFSDPRTLGGGDVLSYVAVVSGEAEGIASTAFDLTIDITGPSVVVFSTASTPDGSYKEGDTITLAAIFDDLVLAGSSFEVTLDTGDVVTLTTSFVSTVLLGTYIVGAGDSSLGLNVTSYNVGTLQDTVGNAMTNTDLPVGSNLADNTAIVIDTTPPEFAATDLFTSGQTVSSTQGGVRTVASADIDGDGDMDIVSASVGDNTLSWFANDGTGNFGSEQLIGSADAFATSTADLDGDGDQDVLMGTSNSNRVSWFENDGAGNFGAEQIISNTQQTAVSVVSGDLDGDGDLDVLSASFGGDKVVWFDNDGSGNFGAEQVISATQGGARKVTAADLDGDGDLDVLIASRDDNTVAWFANDGSGNFGAEQVISATLGGAAGVITADLDGDGDLDVVAAAPDDNTLSWFANDGTGNFGTEQVIDNTQNAFGLDSADVDGDGDIDIVLASFSDGMVTWFINDGLGGFTLGEVISTTQNGTSTIVVADIDNEGSIDLVVGSQGDNTVAWYGNKTPSLTENSGAGQVVYTASASDNMTVISYSLGGTDAGFFNIDSGTGAVTLIADPDFETQSSYSFEVVVSDAAGNSATQAVILNVTDVVDPIVLDLDGDGLEYSSVGVLFDTNGDGEKEQTQAWVKADDGLLAYDKNADGQITDTDEIAFVDYLEGAKTDLEGLVAFDTNENGLLDAGDTEFDAFRVWQDLNQDGISDDGELMSLIDAGIASIGLQSDGNQQHPVDGVIEHGQGTYTNIDGTTGTLADVSFTVMEIDDPRAVL